MDTQRHSDTQPEVSPPSSMAKRLIYRVLRLVIFVYLGLLLLAVAFEKQLVYHGTPTSLNYQYPGCEEHTIRTRDDVSLHAISIPHPASDRWAIFFHGNAGNLEHRVGFLKELSFQLQRNVFAVDYRGFGKSGGSPSEDVLIHDAEEFVDYAIEHLGLLPEECFVVGRSLGGGVAVQLASKQRFEALILINTFTSLPDVASEIYPFLPTQQIMRNRFDSLSIADTIQIPVFQTHDRQDEIISFKNGRALYDNFKAPKDFWIHENATHNTAMPAEFYQALKRFLRSL